MEYKEGGLEIWEARRLDKIQDAGRTHPLIIECASTQTGNSQRRSFIVKALALPEIKETSLGFEIVGNMLARRLGVDTPEPVLVHLSPAFVEAYQPISLSLRGILVWSAREPNFCPDMGLVVNFFRQASCRSFQAVT